jgi:protein SCO1/2
MLARTDATSVRKLAAVLGIQYRALPDGEFNHSTELILLDDKGHIAARIAKMGVVDAGFVSQVSAAAASARH